MAFLFCNVHVQTQLIQCKVRLIKRLRASLMHIFIVHNRCSEFEERLTPRGVMTIRVSQENLRRDSSFNTLEVVR